MSNIGEAAKVLNRTTTFNEKLGIFLKTDFSSALSSLKRGQKIYRGIKNGELKQIKFVQPSKVERASKNTTNFVTAILTCLPSWSEYPKRSRSLVCSFSKSYADGYGYRGSVNLVLPKNGAKIGVCSSGDFWNTFPRLHAKTGFSDVDELNGIIQRILSAAGISLEDNWNENNVLEKLKQLESIDYTIVGKKYGCEKIIKSKQGYDSWLNFFDDVLNPERNGIQLMTVEDFSSNNSSEVWLDSDSILVDVNHKLAKLYDKNS